MGEAERRIPEDPALIAAEHSIGRYLARQRELRGLSLDDLAHITRLPRRSLERLETGVFDGQTDGFARGFVRTVAGALGLDPVDTVTRMLSEPDGQRRTGSGGGRPAGARAIALLAAGATGLVALLAWWISTAEVRMPVRTEAGGGVVYRPDPVRDLADDVREMVPDPPAVPPPTSAGPAGSVDD